MLTSYTRRALLLIPALLLASACGGGGGASGTDGAGGSTSTSGDGGSGNGSTTSNNTGGGGNTTSTGTGGAEACHPSETDPLANQCTSSCECLPTTTSSDEWCNNMANQSLDACPAEGNRCWAGMNNCAYDLPIGEAYQMPSCTDKVNGDGWLDEFSNEGDALSKFDPNGQLDISFGLIGPEAFYFEGLRLSGKKLYWNRANVGTLESGEGEFADDCNTVTMRFYYAGEAVPYATQTIFWSHD